MKKKEIKTLQNSKLKFGELNIIKGGGSNPQTGKPITIKAKTVAKFKAGSYLSSSVQ